MMYDYKIEQFMSSADVSSLQGAEHVNSNELDEDLTKSVQGT